MITRGDIGRRIWIYQIIKRTTDSTDNNTYTELFRCYRMGIINNCYPSRKVPIYGAFRDFSFLSGTKAEVPEKAMEAVKS